MSLIIVTGMSGAGKSNTLEALEDIGYFCVDNVPPVLLSKFASMQNISDGAMSKLCVVVDSRGKQMFESFLDELSMLDEDYKLLFLNASDETLLNRYKEVRRRHPLCGDATQSTADAIKLERVMLGPAKEAADFIIDTSMLTVGNLKEQVVSMFSENVANSLNVRVVSFGFKNGVPAEADMVFDVRALPNPFYVGGMRDKRGYNKEVADFIWSFDESVTLLGKITDLVDFLLPLYIREARSSLVIAVGCTGGHHRSIAFAEAIKKHVVENGVNPIIIHRDADR